MSGPKLILNIAQKLDITEPARESAYPIPVSDWEYLRMRVTQIPGTESLFHTIGSAVLGVTASALVAAKTLPTDQMICNTSAVTLAWIIMWASLAIGILSLIFSHRQRKVQVVSAKLVTDEMDRLKRKYGNC